MPAVKCTKRSSPPPRVPCCGHMATRQASQTKSETKHCPKGSLSYNLSTPETSFTMNFQYGEGDMAEQRPLQTAQGLFLGEENHGGNLFTDCCSTHFPSLSVSPWNENGSNVAPSSTNDKASKVAAMMPKSLSGRIKGNNADEGALILTEGFEKLSVEERERSLNALHGVEDLIEETPSFIAQALDELKVNISQTKRQECTAYDRAVFLNPNYVENKDFRLMFLRSERFNVEKATVRMMKHFRLKLEIFGYERLARDITFDDLDQDTVDILMNAMLWFLNLYDRSGRRIFLVTSERKIFRKPINFLRACWYLFMVAAEDVQTQINGGITVIFSAGDSLRKPADIPSMLQLSRILTSIPLYWAGSHFCYEDNSAAKLKVNSIRLVQFAMDPLSRSRFRIHKGGSPLEMKYALLNFGVPAESLPFDESGHLVDDEFRVQMAKRKEWEKQIRDKQTSSGFIETPSSRFDVLLGRGRLYQDFPGNVRLTQLVELRYVTYEAATLSEKTDIAIEIVHAIQNMGGRFLTRRQTVSDDKTNNKNNADSDSGGSDCDSDSVGKKKVVNDNRQRSPSSASWVEVDFKVAHRKVSVAFQTRKRRKS